MRFAHQLKIWGSLSLAVIIFGMVMALVSGVNLGIDFTGGTMIHVNIGESFEVSEIRELIEPFELQPDIIHAGMDKTQVIIKTKVSLNNTQRMAVFSTLSEVYDLTDEDFLEAEQFGPAIGAELQNKALSSILFAAIGMLLYITFRFEWLYGISAIIALIHDVLILLAVYVIFQIPVNSSFIAAVLTIVGYSINDTIVVFDRVRENVKTMGRESFKEVADRSLKQTLTRSINTSLTTLLVIGSLYVLGVEAIKEFTLPLMAGVLVGTYSSIFIASPLWATFKDMKRRAKRKG
ncbi:MAG: preprotein translocase subunit SecF [delta proteobacterium ML8_F1]|nr:MAG: preprotein translocase subunit SecF [delta proteobacterium ML8_F1]